MKRHNRRGAVTGCVAAWLLTAGPAAAFNLFANPARRPAGSYVFLADIARNGNPSSPSGISWNDAFESAANRWNTATPLVDLAVGKGAFEDPCDEEAFDTGVEHGVGFAATACGDAFGAQTLAVALPTFGSGGLIREGNIVFKNDDSVTWDVFDAPLASRPGVVDFRRVAIHELGHLLGLDHEDDVPAIMKSAVSDLVAPQPDDLAGIAALYDLTCPIFESITPGTGTILGVLGVADGDCFDTEVGLALPSLAPDPGVQPDSFVDLYAVTLSGATMLNAELSAGPTAFNPVVQILDATLSNQLAADWNGAGDTAAASAVLPPGDYVVVARSLFAGNGGDYTLTLIPEPSRAAAALAAIAALGALLHFEGRRGRARSAGSRLRRRTPARPASAARPAANAPGSGTVKVDSVLISAAVA